MAPDYKRQIARALANQRAAEVNRKAAFADDHSARQMPASILSVADVAAIISETMGDQKREIIEHVHRLFQLTKLSDRTGDTRDQNLHRRLCVVESELRALKRGRR